MTGLVFGHTGGERLMLQWLDLDGLAGLRAFAAVALA